MKEEEDKQELIRFPTSIQAGQVFDSLNEVLERIKEETKEKHMPGKRPFQIRYRPRKKNFYYIWMPCKYCKASLSLRKNDQQKLVVRFVNHNHSHSTKLFGNRVERQVYAMYKKQVKFTDTAPLRDQILKEFQLSNFSETKLLRRFEAFDTFGFEQLEQWLKENNYMYRCDWQDEPRDRYPRSMVLISPGMRQNYLRFGDLVAFDITYGLLRNVAQDSRRYNVGVFTVNDTNLRMLFAGIAILIDETKQALYTVFDNFIQLHGRAPASFITDGQESFAAAINELRCNQLFYGAHMLDPWHLLKAIKPKIHGNNALQEAKLEKIMQLMVERNIDYYRRDKEMLKADPSTASVIEEMDKKKEQIFFCEVEGSFIGIRRNNCEGINDLIKRDVPQEVRIEQLLEKIHILQQRLIYRSTHEFILMNEPVEKIFCDDRIEQIRLNYEKKVVHRFLENYTKGFREFQIVEKGVDTRSGKPTFVVQFVDSSTRYVIRNWNCSCNELDKTGVGCAHLLLAATTTAGKSYDELMSRRWKKDPLQLEKAAAKYLLATETEMPSRRKTRRTVDQK